jgi:hypothetical protein
VLVVVWSFLFLFFETKREGGVGGREVMFVNFFFLTHIWYQIMGSEFVLKPAFENLLV